jgi:hypothetical protein
MVENNDCQCYTCARDSCKQYKCKTTCDKCYIVPYTTLKCLGYYRGRC